MMLVLVAITTEHVQVAVALATQTLVRCVMNVQAPGPSTALTTTAGKRQRTSSTCAPMGGTQIPVAIPGPRAAAAARPLERPDYHRHEHEHHSPGEQFAARVLTGRRGERPDGLYQHAQLIGSHRLTTQPPGSCVTSASVTCGPGGRPA